MTATSGSVSQEPWLSSRSYLAKRSRLGSTKNRRGEACQRRPCHRRDRAPGARSPRAEDRRRGHDRLRVGQHRQRRIHAPIRDWHIRWTPHAWQPAASCGAIHHDRQRRRRRDVVDARDYDHLPDRRELLGEARRVLQHGIQLHALERDWAAQPQHGHDLSPAGLPR